VEVRSLWLLFHACARATLIVGLRTATRRNTSPPGPTMRARWYERQGSAWGDPQAHLRRLRRGRCASVGGGTFTVMKESWPRGCRLAARADTRRFQQPFTLVFMALAEWWPPNKAGSTESVPQVRRMQRGHGAKRRTRLQCSRRTHWALANSTPGHLAMFEHAPLSDTWWCGIRRAARVQSGRGR
jgi:hypothetical protein